MGSDYSNVIPMREIRDLRRWREAHMAEHPGHEPTKGTGWCPQCAAAAVHWEDAYSPYVPLKITSFEGVPQ